jgi:outer membrane protein OmpA-like peptidoglycan-associated protein
LNLRTVVLAVLSLVVLSSCSNRKELFVVLPNADGSSGAITVDDGQNKVLLNKPYAAGEVRRAGVANVPIESGEVNQVFASALGAQPRMPQHFILYFKFDKDQLTPESAPRYKDVFEDIKARPVYEVEVIGYTDTMGQQKYNQELSLNRAGAIRERLIHDGLDPKSISIAGRGPLDPLVRTGDQVAEPRNRRVVITVR